MGNLVYNIIFYGFFIFFFIFGFISIGRKIYNLLKESNNEPINIRLYQDGNFSTDLKNIYNSRLSDTSTRSSVRYHKSLYLNDDNYQNYKENIMKLQLP